MNQDLNLRDSYSMKSSGVIDIYTGGQAVTSIGLEIAPQPPLRLCGYVRDRFSGGRGIAAATVMAFTAANEFVTKTVTDQAGFYVFEGLACGSLRLTAGKEGHAPAPFVSLVLEPGESISQNLVLPPLDSCENLVYGRVTAGGQNALPGARIDILRQDGGAAATTLAAADGSYAAYGLPDGVFTVIISAQGYGSRRFEAAVGALARIVNVNAALAPEDAPAQGAAIGGFITSQQGAPLPGAWVGLYAVGAPGGESLVATAFTTADGFYSFCPVAPGKYCVKAKAMVM